MTLFVILTLSYLLGSVPFGLLIARYKKVDIRRHGSGNIGATNVNRALGKGAGILTLVLDCAKGALPVAFALSLTGDDFQAAGAGMAAFLGHLFPVFLKFKGGKGVATGLGVFLYATPAATLCCMAVFAITVAASRYVSLGSMLAALSLPLFGYLFHPHAPYWYASGAVAGLIVFKHRENIERLFAGTENKLGQK